MAITPAAIKSSAGAWVHLRSRCCKCASAIEDLKQAGYWIAALAPEGAVTVYDLDTTRRLVRVVGSKGRGVREIVKKGADFVVRIPMRGRIGSLNVSVAAALPLSDIARRRGAAAGTTVGANAGGTNRDNGSRMLVRYGARPLQRQTARAPDRGRRLRRATGVCKPSAGERHVSQQRVASEANMKGELANLDATEQAELLRRKEVLSNSSTRRPPASKRSIRNSTQSSRRCLTRRVRRCSRQAAVRFPTAPSGESRSC